MTQQNNSEVARIKAQIDAEVTSAERALRSPAYGTAQHKFITARMERMGMLHDQLQPMIGDDRAALLLIDALNRIGPVRGPGNS